VSPTPGRELVALLAGSGHLGGAERGLTNLALALQETRYQPLAMLPAPGALEDELRRHGVPTMRLRPPTRLSRLSRSSSLAARMAAAPALLSHAGRLATRLADLGPALLWTQGVKPHLYGSMAAWWAGVPCLVHLRDLDRPAGFGLVERLATHVVANSEATLRAARTRGEVLPNTVPVAELRRAGPPRDEARRRLGLPADAFVVLAVGALTEHKGQERLLEAFLPVLADHPQAHLVLAGGEPYRTEGHGGLATRLRTRAEAAGAEAHVHLLGDLPAPWPAYRAADVFALPSRSEGSGRAYLEAAAFGLPLLATRVGGPGELFPDGAAELLDPEDGPAWEDALRRLADDQTMRRRLSHAARGRVAAFDRARLPEQVAALVARARGGGRR
jgi:glycosyltransferase involved in cell wall biosynthesis